MCGEPNVDAMLGRISLQQAQDWHEYLQSDDYPPNVLLREILRLQHVTANAGAAIVSSNTGKSCHPKRFFPKEKKRRAASKPTRRQSGAAIKANCQLWASLHNASILRGR